VIYSEWERMPGTKNCLSLDTEVSPVLATVDDTFWSEHDINILRTTDNRLSVQCVTKDLNDPTGNEKMVVSVIPSILGCPLPPSCFRW
jgi:hypothetical protein